MKLTDMEIRFLIKNSQKETKKNECRKRIYCLATKKKTNFLKWKKEKSSKIGEMVSIVLFFKCPVWSIIV